MLSQHSRRAVLSALATASVLAAGMPGAGCSSVPAPASSRELLVDASRSIDVLVDGVGPTLVLLPSSQRDSLDFDPVAHRLASLGFRVLRPQPRGMGRSSPPPPGMTLETLASDVALCIERLAPERSAVIVGHAYGHWVARVADLKYPELVRGVVVLGASAKEFPPGLVEKLAVAADPTQPEARRLDALRASMFAPGNDPRSWLDGWHPRWRAAYREAGQKPPKDQWFNSANAPILDLQGAQDPWRPPSTRDELRALFPQKVTVQVIAGASHALIPEQPEAVANAIAQWAKSLRR